MQIKPIHIARLLQVMARLVQKPRISLILLVLAFIFFSSNFAFPYAHAADIPDNKGLDLGQISFGNLFIPYLSQGRSEWPSMAPIYPPPSTTPEAVGSTSTSVPEPSPSSTPTGQLLFTPTASLSASSTATPIPTSSPTPTFTRTATHTPTSTSTPTSTATPTFTQTPTQDPRFCDDPVRVMPLGDSITRGSGSTNINGYRRPLYLSLQGDGYWIDFVGSLEVGSSDFDRHHEGHSGWSADGGTRGSIADSVYSFLTENPADTVLLHIGTNDVQEGHQDPEDVARILDEIRRKSADIQVILALIINQKIYSPETSQYNEQVRELASERIAMGHSLLLVDMEKALSYPEDMYDLVHPNDSGYAKMAVVWYGALIEILPLCPHH
jgi:lysophospholipase L1-like esterase